MSDSRQGQMRAGIILIVVGLVFFVANRYDLFGADYFFLLLGAAFLVFYFLKSKHGLLIPGALLIGLGLGEAIDGGVIGFGDGGQLGLGFGFVLIWLIALVYERRSVWWPLIPGGFLILLGLDATEDVARYLFENWPLILVIVGVLLIFGAFGRRARGG